MTIGINTGGRLGAQYNSSGEPLSWQPLTLPIVDCRFSIGLIRYGPIGNRQSTIGNVRVFALQLKLRKNTAQMNDVS